MPSTGVSLRADNVTYTYPDGPRALRGVSFQVAPGRLVVIVGPNGSGKSTLLRVLAGIRAPDGGEVTLDGRSLASVAPAERARRIGFLPQQVEVAFPFTVAQVVLSGRFPHLGPFGLERPEDVRVVEQVMRETEVDGFAGRRFEALSGGERQRVLIASVLAQQPGVLLLDEPTSALDLRYQTGIYDLLREQARRGLAVCVVTHDLNLAAQFADRLVLMNEGLQAAEGEAGQVLTREVLEPVYATRIAVGAHPVTGAPAVFPLAKGARDPGGGQVEAASRAGASGPAGEPRR